LYDLSKASGLRSSPSAVNLLHDGTLILSLGTAADQPALSPWSDMLAESLLLLELSGSPGGATTGALLDDPFDGESGNPPGLLLQLVLVLLLIPLDLVVHYLWLGV